jgi:hypothetical protein
VKDITDFLLNSPGIYPELPSQHSLFAMFATTLTKALMLCQTMNFVEWVLCEPTSG